MSIQVYFWVGFHFLIAFFLIADLRRKTHAITFKEALVHSGVWIGLALVFDLFIYIFLGPEQALAFFTGFLIEKSLSVDNLFVFLALFHHFQIPSQDQHKILHWGILGALVFRLSFIVAGAALISRFHGMYYVFGALLLFSAIKFAFQSEEKKGSQGFFLSLLEKIFPSARKGRHAVFFPALLAIEGADILFALDSIPAIFAITTDPLIVYTSNVFAILGLRSLYFLLAPSLEKLRYFKWGLAAILVFVSAKMLLKGYVDISTLLTLAVIALILLVTIMASLLRSPPFRK